MKLHTINTRIPFLVLIKMHKKKVENIMHGAKKSMYMNLNNMRYTYYCVNHLRHRRNHRI